MFHVEQSLRHSRPDGRSSWLLSRFARLDLWRHAVMFHGTLSSVLGCEATLRRARAACPLYLTRAPPETLRQDRPQIFRTKRFARKESPGSPQDGWPMLHVNRDGKQNSPRGLRTMLKPEAQRSKCSTWNIPKLVPFLAVRILPAEGRAPPAFRGRRLCSTWNT